MQEGGSEWPRLVPGQSRETVMARRTEIAPEIAPEISSGAKPAASPTGDPWLLTPGPLTTSPGVKRAMLHDYGSRDHHFIALNRRIRERLVAMAGGTGTHVCVPLQIGRASCRERV